MVERDLLVQNAEGFLEENKTHFIRFALSLLYANNKSIDQEDVSNSLESLYDSLLVRDIEIEYLQEQVYRGLGHDTLMANYMVSRSMRERSKFRVSN